MQGIIGQLFTEWDDLCARTASETTNQRMQLWAQREPALADFATMAEISTTRETADNVFAALIRLGQGHGGHTPEPDAHRAVLHQILPWIWNIAASIQGCHDRDLNATDLIAEAWDRISNYSLSQRPNSIHANIVYDALRAVAQERKLTDTPIGIIEDQTTNSWVTPENILNNTTNQEPVLTESGIDVDSSYEEVLEWAVDRNVITAERAELLRDTYLPHTNGIEVPPHFLTGSVAAAQKRGIKPDHARQLCKRANDKIKAALHSAA